MTTSMPGAGDRVGDVVISFGLGCGASGPVYEAVGPDGRGVLLKLARDNETIAHHAARSRGPIAEGSAGGWLFLALSSDDPAGPTLADDPVAAGPSATGSEASVTTALDPSAASVAATAPLFIDEVPLATIRRGDLESLGTTAAAASREPQDGSGVRDAVVGERTAADSPMIDSASGSTPAAHGQTDPVEESKRRWPVVMGAAAATLALVGGLVWGLGLRNQGGSVTAEAPRSTATKATQPSSASTGRPRPSASPTSSMSPSASASASESTPADPAHDGTTSSAAQGRTSTSTRPATSAPAVAAAPQPAAPAPAAPVKPVAPATTVPPPPPPPTPDNCPGGDFSPTRYDGICGTPPPPPPDNVQVFKANPARVNYCNTSTCYFIGLSLQGWASDALCTFIDPLEGPYRVGVPFPANFYGPTQFAYGYPGRQLVVSCTTSAGGRESRGAVMW